MLKKVKKTGSSRSMEESPNEPLPVDGRVAFLISIKQNFFHKLQDAVHLLSRVRLLGGHHHVLCAFRRPQVSESVVADDKHLPDLPLVVPGLGW